jgi:magnesium-transporting ATPase (P-type)
MGEAIAVDTPLTRKIARFSGVLMRLILGLAIATYAVGLARGEDAADMLVAAVALAVAAIPEGLPAAVTITLAIGVSRMARRRAVVRRLPAVETLGSTTVICSDKTGTLTENRMTVQAVVTADERFGVSGPGHATAGEVEPAERAARSAALRECLVAGALCNDARLGERSDGGVEIVGDPTEAALLVAARKGGVDVDRLVAERPRVATIPFRSERRFMATLHEGSRTHSPVAYVKGAAEHVLAMCSTAAGDAGPVPLDRERLLDVAHELGARGLRVLAVARDATPDVARFRAGEVGDGLELLGLQAMLDPPRPQAIRAVSACQRAGIAVKMITGDHVATAQAIADRIGLDGRAAGESAVAAMTGADIAACSDEQLTLAAERTAVFARVSPEQKLRLVEALQTNGEVVAMTGDGVNDAPALKRADIGVAMGRGGTDVARDAADIVLTDDDFASIEAAVEEGRRTFDNLTKFIVWTLPTNMGEGLLVLAAIAVGATLPILPVQILWINMTSAGALGVMLAFERSESGIMDRPPRDPGQPLLTRELMGRIVLVSALLLGGAFGIFQWALDSGMPVAEARTAAVNLFVAGELFYLLNCRSLERSILHVGVLANRWVVGGIAATVALQLLFTYAPQMNSLFDSAPIGWDAWARILAFGVALWAIVGAEKWIRRRRHDDADLRRAAASCRRDSCS